MENLMLAIENFSDWDKPWTFYSFVMGSTNLSDVERDQFANVYKEAAKFELWNVSNLDTGIGNAKAFLKEHTSLSDSAIHQIAKAIAYEWK